MPDSSPNPRLHETTVTDSGIGRRWPGPPAETIFLLSGDHASPLSGDQDGSQSARNSLHAAEASSEPSPSTAPSIRLLSPAVDFMDPVHAWIRPVRPASRRRGGDQGELHLHARQIREVARALLLDRQLPAGLLHLGGRSAQSCA